MTEQTPVRSPRLWRRRLIVLGAIVAVLAIVHVPVLRAIGGFLSADDPVQAADCLVLLPSVSGDSALAQKAAANVREGKSHAVLYFTMPANRGEQCGALPNFASEFRRQLLAGGLDAASIIVLPGPSRNSWEAARALDRWLAEHPQATVTVLCREFRGRYERHVLATQIDAARFQRVAFLTDYGTDGPSKWWTSREAIQTVFQNFARLTFVVLNGESNPGATAWSYDDYLRTLPPAKRSLENDEPRSPSPSGRGPG